MVYRQHPPNHDQRVAEKQQEWGGARCQRPGGGEGMWCRPGGRHEKLHPSSSRRPQLSVLLAVLAPLCKGSPRKARTPREGVRGRAFKPEVRVQYNTKSAGASWPEAPPAPCQAVPCMEPLGSRERSEAEGSGTELRSETLGWVSVLRATRASACRASGRAPVVQDIAATGQAHAGNSRCVGSCGRRSPGGSRCLRRGRCALATEIQHWWGRVRVSKRALRTQRKSAGPEEQRRRARAGKEDSEDPAGGERGPVMWPVSTAGARRLSAAARPGKTGGGT
jgi:hypothetical protein